MGLLNQMNQQVEGMKQEWLHSQSASYISTVISLVPRAHSKWEMILHIMAGTVNEGECENTLYQAVREGSKQGSRLHMAQIGPLHLPPPYVFCPLSLS